MRIVVKIGSSTLTRENGKINLRLLEKYVRVFSDLNNAGYEVIIVSSGAQVVGRAKLNLDKKPDNTPQKQAIAAVGQCELMSIYDKLFLDYGCRVAQILLTKDVMDVPERKENVINTFRALLDYGCIPIVNENDSVEVEEIKFGDNDTLSAMVACCTEADKLIMMTDIDGLYTGNPKTDPTAKRIPEVSVIDDSVRALAGDTGSDKGTGGMITKIRAAEIATAEGIDVYIVSGSDPYAMYDIIEEGKHSGTHFTAKKD